MYSGTSTYTCTMYIVGTIGNHLTVMIVARGVLNSGVVLYRITTIGTKASVHIREVFTVRGSTVVHQCIMSRCHPILSGYGRHRLQT